VQASEEILKQIWSTIVSTNNDGGDVSTMLMDYTRENRKRENHMSILIKLYETEIIRLNSEDTKNHLSTQQKLTIKEEMKVLECVCDKNIRSTGNSSLHSLENISPSIFMVILEEVNGKCPMVHDMIEALVISNKVNRNILKTNAHKMVCGLQTLGFISNIRSSKTRNCFPLMFGLLCIIILWCCQAICWHAAINGALITLGYYVSKLYSIIITLDLFLIVLSI
jgi:hypothetical protein